MSKNRLLQIVLGGFSLLIITAVILTWVNLAESDDIDAVTFSLEDGKTEILTFENLSLIPGDECVYKVQLKGDNPKAYNVNFDFKEHFDMDLKQFARVKMVADGVEFYDGLLAEAIDKDDINLHIGFDMEDDVRLEITYYLPIDVGNEAKNASAVFDLRITATNE